MPLIYQPEKAPVLTGGTLLKSGARVWNFGHPSFDGQPINANSYSGATSSINDLIDGALQIAGGFFTPLKGFTTLKDAYAFNPSAPHVYKITTSGGTVQINPTNWQTNGDGNINAGTVTMAQYSASVHVTNNELNAGLRITDFLPKLFTNLATTLTGQLFAQITSANFPAAAVTTSGPAFGTGDSAAAFAAIPNAVEKFLVLNSTQFGYLNASAGARGFMSGESVLGWNGVYQNSVAWTGKLAGFAGGREALVIVAGRPALPAVLPGNLLARKVIELPNGFLIELNTWISTSDRTYWMSGDVVAGFGTGDSNVGVLINTP